MADTEASKAPEQASEEVKKPVEETKAEGKEASTAAPEEKKTEECEGAYGGARIRNPEESDEEEDDDDFDDDEDFDDEDEDTEEEEDKEGFMNMLQNFLMSKLHLGSQEEVPKANSNKVLEEVTVEGVVNYIKSGKCKNIITMAGAGISTSAGIPDFRTPGTGLYSNLEKYNLPFPEAIFDIEYFRNNPKPFFVLAKELYPGTFAPTPSHWFIRLLHDKGLLLRHYTQNIDTLEHVAGLPADKVVEAHGTFRTSHCLNCRKEYSQEWVKEEIFKDSIPTCTECSGLVKPDIIFFRESLPVRFFQLMQSDFPKCDLLIILGTSLTVQPFASLVDNVPAMCPRLLINREKAGTVDPMMAMLQGMFGSAGLALDSPNNIRDVALLGDCDEGCVKMAEFLGWKDDMQALLATTKK
ncbi:NAD-dependent protein deacetylase sirtuin-2 [Penaeus vannamei]|uniref:NAD-dependent protein deacetylase sirtuin-2 n=1 Tax=Penaeus vannamei TaxID=6689 RepID=UPI000F68FDA9|nr:NAD-dependent protein deacetylase sirtuin-2-like isoform X1 [Penaeus vannamei]XP_027214428.1 NAD-dependent protein deacetylase sirtuin-2-like isoform X1 [Penaeus vannamei]XP_027214429.1 NAD-dependent protein deacetylase sirtuin-2-like isoform X1 [Penaeus vannamei]